MKRAALTYCVGCGLIALGCLWIGQGAGYFPYPQTSMMIGDQPWEFFGGASAITGAVIIVTRLL